MSELKNICILGSTGTIGVNTLDVVSRHPDLYRVVALTANTNVEKLFQQCATFKPAFAAMYDDDSAEQLNARLQQAGIETAVFSGMEGLQKLAAEPQVDYVMAAIVGAAGLLPTLAAAREGKRILLANKEALVMSGAIFMDEVKQNNATLLPIDSEHNAIFQCMPEQFSRGLENSGVNKILLTASGGPFRNKTPDELKQVTPEQAVAHPNWVMGQKISVDSATMMNKGLEVIEACWLFNTRPEMIQVVVHPESVIHSMVSYNDGSVLAQLGNPDMRTPIAHSLAWPHRIASGVEPLDIFKVAQLNFEEADFDRFPCLRLAYEALNMGGTATCILNAANEIAVDAFLNKQLAFNNIANVIESSLQHISIRDAVDIDTILNTDHESRLFAREQVKRLEFKQ